MTNLKRLLEKSRVSQSELSRRSGIDRPTLCDLANNKRPMYPAWRSRIAQALNVDEGAL